MQGKFPFLRGLVAAPHTPMTPEGALNLAMVPRQAKILAAQGVSGAFVCGSTGESHSLTTAERMRVAEAWASATRATSVKLIVHAGHNCLEDAKALAAHAAGINADAVAAMAPCYFKPGSPQDLAAFCAGIAAAAPSLPFYFYDIPSMTGVELPMPEFLKHAGRIPNFAGLKFTSADLMSLQRCLELEGGRYNVLFGSDEMLLAALALGAHGAVGSTYNYAAPLYQNILKAFRAGDLEQARTLQMKSVQLVEVLCRYGVLAGGKALMALVGADCGPVRLPLRPLTGEQIETLRQEVESLGVLAAAPRNAVPA